MTAPRRGRRPLRPARVAGHVGGHLDRPRAACAAPSASRAGSRRGRRAWPATCSRADLAYPEPLLADPGAAQAHQAWTHGQVLLVEYDGRLTLAVPGTAYSADGALETISRLAKAVGVRPGHFAVTLRL